MTAASPLNAELATRLSGSPLLVLLDVDGTLAPIAPRPDDVVVPEETRRALARLAGLPAVHVAIVSGRGAADAQRLVPLKGLWVIGNHGLETIAPNGELTVDRQVEPYRAPMALASRALHAGLASLTGVIVEDKVWSLSVHYRLADANRIPLIRAAVEEQVRAHGLRLTEGKRVFEVRAPIRVDKGTAVLQLALELGALAETASLLFAGDDLTDEDAFRLLRARDARAVTVRVSGDERRPTAAEFSVHNPDEVRELLVWLASMRS